MQHDRLLWLDATRGLAALTVLAAHTLDYSWRGYADFIQLGNAGVVLFFICSGYVIPISLEALSLRDFWVRRFFRLFPLYWLSIALFLAFGINEAGDLGAIAANMTMLQSYLGMPHVSAIFWSLTVEITFYGLISALRLLRLLGSIFEVFLALMIGLVMLRLVNPGLANMLVYLPVCLLGTLIYRVEQRRYAPRTLLTGLAVLACYLCTWPAPAAFILGWLIAIGLFVALYAARALFWPAWLVWCGQVSYSIYLLHNIPLRFSHSWGIPLVFLVAAVSYAVIERPAIRLGRKLSRPVSDSSLRYGLSQGKGW